MDNEQLAELDRTDPHYKIIEDDKGETSLIPIAWLISENEAYWPSWGSHYKVNRAIAKEQAPDPATWMKFRIVRTFGQARK